MIDPEAIPRLPHLEELAADVRALRAAGAGFRDTGARVHGTWQGLAGCYEAPEAVDLLTATGLVRRDAAAVGADIVAVAAALDAYLAEMRPVAARLRSLHDDANRFVIYVAVGPDWRADAGKLGMHNQLVRDVDAAVADFQAAERRAANAIGSLVGGPRYHVGDGKPDPYAYGYAGPFPAGARRPWGTPEQADRPWYSTVAHGVGALARGYYWDGVIQGELRGGLNMAGYWGRDGAGFSVRTLRETWTGLAALGVSLVPGVRTANDSAALPGLPRGEATLVVGSAAAALTARDMWRTDPSRAAGLLAWNALSTLTLAAAGKLAGTARLAADLDHTTPATHLPTTTDLARAYGEGRISLPGLDRIPTADHFPSARDAWISGLLRDAVKQKGNYGLGCGTKAEANALGEAWVGQDARLSQHGDALVSRDGLRQYRFPLVKRSTGYYQANFESRFRPAGRWQNDGHLDIQDGEGT